MGRSYSSRQRKVSSGIEGADEAIKLLKDMGIAAENVLEKAAEEGGKIALKEAKRRCPVDSGRLKASLHLTKGRKSESKADVKIAPGKQEYYGTFVELGTKHQGAKPYLRPAVDEKQGDIAKAVNQTVLRALGRFR